MMDTWWNEAIEQQAIDRTHRIGQTKNVFAYKMICKDTIEEKIMVLQQRKKKLAEELIGERIENDEPLLAAKILLPDLHGGPQGDQSRGHAVPVFAESAGGAQGAGVPERRRWAVQNLRGR